MHTLAAAVFPPVDGHESSHEYLVWLAVVGSVLVFVDLT